MVCVPCIVIPVLLWLWHRFLQPIFLKLYNPWQKVENKDNSVEVNGTAGQGSPGAGSGLPATCPFTANKKQEAEIQESDKKLD